jgi:CelD/BcsL family acetyltransferase involved in cellulose biosynthesis
LEKIADPDKLSFMEMSDIALRCEWVTDEAEFERLRQPWNELTSALERQSMFLRHEWFTAAWQWRKADGTLQLLCVYRGSGLVAVCPLILRRHRKYGAAWRALEFLTVPDTQLCDVIVRFADRQSVAGAIAKALVDAEFPWDVLRLSYLEKGSAAGDPLRLALGSFRVGAEVAAGHSNPFIDLAGGWEAFYRGRSRRLKKANNYVANRIERAAGGAEVAWVNSSSAEADVAQAVAAAVEISNRSWKQQTGNSLDQSGPNRFIRSISEFAHRNGWLSIWLLLIDAKPVAMEYQLIYDGQVHALRADYDQEFQDLSPGSYLNWKLLMKLFDADCDRYWMGPGENPYKFRWTDSVETLFETTAYNRRLRGRMLGVLDRRVMPTVKRLLRGARAPARDADQPKHARPPRFDGPLGQPRCERPT